MVSIEEPRFHEVQPLRHWWLWVVIVLLAALAWWAFVQQVLLGVDWGDAPMPDSAIWVVWLLFGLLVPRLAFLFRLETTVTDEHLRIAFRPFHRRRIRLEKIIRCRAREYRPFREFLGWGVRWTPGRGWAYTVSGHEGVQVTLEGGHQVLVGSRRAETLAAIVREAAGVESTAED